jgi:GAF domain-containing protein
MEPKRARLVIAVQDAVAELDSETAVLEKAARMIDDFADGYNWTGFYMMRGDHLEVGPYIGPTTEHTRIELNHGICGAAATQKKTVAVDDVQADPRFLACSLSTRSEIVVPLMDGDECFGEIDIDSNQPAFFTDADQAMLEAIAEVIVDRLRRLRERS